MLSQSSSSSSIYFITQFNNLTAGGLGRYEQSLYPLLKQIVGAQLARMEPWPIPKLVTAAARAIRRDLKTISLNYPCRIPVMNQAHLIHLSHQTLALSLLFQKPERVIVTVHDLIPYIETKKTGRGQAEMTGFWEKQFYYAALRGLRKAHGIIANSKKTRQDLVQILHIPESLITVVPLGVDRQVFKPKPVPQAFFSRLGLDASGQYLLYVGSQEARKNLPLLFRSMCEIQRRIPEAKLLIAGTPRSSFSDSYPGLLHEMGVAEFVRFLGFVTESDLVNLYNLSRLLVMPSLNEGFGLPVLEAMACGCPVISSNTTSLSEVIESAGIQLNPYDEKAWVEAITEVLANEPLQKGLTEAGLDRAGMFSWEATAEATAAVYQRAMQ